VWRGCSDRFQPSSQVPVPLALAMRPVHSSIHFRFLDHDGYALAVNPFRPSTGASGDWINGPGQGEPTLEIRWPVAPSGPTRVMQAVWLATSSIR
jgi:hypothetical protein